MNKKLLVKSVRKAEQDPKEKPKIKFNARYNLRRKAAHLSMNTEKDGCVPAELKSPERDGGDNRINTELINSQTLHNNRIAAEQFRQLFQALVDKQITSMHPSIFTGMEGEDIFSPLNKFELLAAINNWNEEKEGLSIAMYLDKPTIIYYNSLPEETNTNQQLVKQALRTRYRRPGQQWQLHSELYALTQTGTLSQYIDDLKSYVSG